jgi:hypothetical protein
LVEEYKKMGTTLEELNLIEENKNEKETKLKHEEWNDVVE